MIGSGADKRNNNREGESGFEEFAADANEDETSNFLSNFHPGPFSGNWNDLSTNESDAASNGNFRDAESVNRSTRCYRSAFP